MQPPAAAMQGAVTVPTRKPVYLCHNMRCGQQQSACHHVVKHLLICPQQPCRLLHTALHCIHSPCPASLWPALPITASSGCLSWRGCWLRSVLGSTAAAWTWSQQAASWAWCSRGTGCWRSRWGPGCGKHWTACGIAHHTHGSDKPSAWHSTVDNAWDASLHS